jgi:hypothetical protein
MHKGWRESISNRCEKEDHAHLQDGEKEIGVVQVISFKSNVFL